MFDTKYTDFNIMNTPYHRDVLKELSEACARGGLALSLYYSNPDWDYKYGYNSHSSHQMPEKGDAAWFAKLGGYINLGKTKAEHPAAGFANAGEKAFFWTFVVFGLCLIVTGLMMLYPAAFGGVSKNSALLALIIHIVSAIVLSAFSVVHIYMGAVMSEGGIENMLSGKCDENWAIQNHSLWYEKVAKGN